MYLSLCVKLLGVCAESVLFPGWLLKSGPFSAATLSTQPVAQVCPEVPFWRWVGAHGKVSLQHTKDGNPT